MRKAFITGITGQDGSYLCELLLSKGYEVHGLIRRQPSLDASRIRNLDSASDETPGTLALHNADLTDGLTLVKLLQQIEPDEIYNLAAQSHVQVSFDSPEHTGDVTGLGAVRLLEAIRVSGIETRVYQASSSEMFGSTRPPQNEASPFHPRSPYGCAKLYGFWSAVNYREAFDMFVANGILFNHESPRRRPEFVTRKVTLSVARIRAGLADELCLGNLDVERDWGYAPEYVDAMWRMLQIDHPHDFVIATGESHTVREFCELAFGHVGLNYQDYVVSNPIYRRPAEVDSLVGDAAKANRILGWGPATRFAELVPLMVDADISLVEENSPTAPVP